MKSLVSMATALSVVAAACVPAFAFPVPIPAVAVNGGTGEPATRVAFRHHVFGHRHGYPIYGNANGGYRINSRGYGNYVRGPAGGFAGYPAGSGAAQIYRQKQEWKCQAVPERC